MAARTRYAIVGTGGRSAIYSAALLGEYADRAELVALCDTNSRRMSYWNSQFKAEHGKGPVSTYFAHEFDTMVASSKPDVVIVTSIDRTHHRYICRAMELGCDAISEKPMTVDAAKCQQILDTIERTGRKLRVTFNYRYAPRNSAVRRVLAEGAIGRVLSVHFEWILDTTHGADYFRRWHRDKRNSGGLMVHKATHHFDLMNWWLQAAPENVFGYGDLKFYGRENAENRGATSFYSRVHDQAAAQGDPFALRLQGNPKLEGLYLNAESEDGYHRDQSVFGDGISIEDDMALVVRYDTGAVMSYHLHAYAPWEGYAVNFNGTKGRLEVFVAEKGYVSASTSDPHAPEGRAIASDDQTSIVVRPHWGAPYAVDFDDAHGGHGGGDTRMLRDIFTGVSDDPLGRAATHVDGARSILTGIAANQSFRTGLPVDVRTLVRLPGAEAR